MFLALDDPARDEANEEAGLERDLLADLDDTDFFDDDEDDEDAEELENLKAEGDVFAAAEEFAQLLEADEMVNFFS